MLIKVIFYLLIFCRVVSGDVVFINSSKVLCDPYNNTINPKRVSGSIVRFYIEIINKTGKKIKDAKITQDVNYKVYNYILRDKTRINADKLHITVGDIEPNSSYKTYYDVILK